LSDSTDGMKNINRADDKISKFSDASKANDISY